MWHFCKQSDTCKLERVQERALRVIFNSKTESYLELLNRTRLNSLHYIAVLMFKVKNSIALNYIVELSKILISHGSSQCAMANTHSDIMALGSGPG